MLKILLIFIFSFTSFGASTDSPPSFEHFQFGSFQYSPPKQPPLVAITHGNRAAPDWPFFTSIFNSDFSRRHPVCGGVLISERYVLTAAHCFGTSRWITGEALKKHTVRIGQTDTKRKDGIKRGLKKILMHQDYNLKGSPSVPYNDLAILILDKEVDIEPIQLPPADLKYLTKEVKVKGFGATNQKDLLYDPGYEPGLPRFLQETNLQVYSSRYCAPRDPRPDLSMLCTWEIEPRSQTCIGDSGGPVALKTDGKWYLIGIVSWSPTGRCARKEPNYLVKVSHFVPWIEKMQKFLDERY